MPWRRVCSFAAKEISGRKSRTTANILGFALAVSSLIMIVSLAQAHNMAAVNILRGTGTHFMIFIPESFSCGCEGIGIEVGPFAEGVYTRTFNESIVSTIRTLPSVKDAAAYSLFRFNELTIGGIDIGRLATNTTACAATDVVKGRYLSLDDKNQTLLEESFANTARLDVNQTMEAFGLTFQIVGIVNSGIKPAKANMYAPIEVVREVARNITLLCSQWCELTDPKDLNVILVEAADARTVEDVRRAAVEAVSEEGSASISGYDCYIPAAAAISMSEQHAWSISLVILVFMTLYALRSQLSTVLERTRDIGVLKAIGWTDSNIMGQIVAESLIQGIVGGAAGSVLGCAGAFLLPFTGLIPRGNLAMTVSPLVVAAGFAVAVAGGALAGIISGWRAVRLKPSEALRHL